MSDENKWSKYKLKIYQGRKGPEPLGSVKFKEIEQKAKEAMKGHLGSYYYGYGSAGVSITEKNNLRAFEKYAIIPRMLVDANTRSFEVTLFGVKYPSPILMSPIGAQAICHPEAEVASARAARNVGIPYIMSTASSRSLEEVAEANGDGFRWYQLYWPRSDEITLSLLRRAEASGYSALVVTVDTQSVGWRPYDLDTAYLPFMHGIGSQVGTSDPVFMARYGLKPALDDRPEFPHDTAKENKLLDDGDEKATQKSRLSMDWVMETIQGKFRPWEDLKILRDNWKGPLLIKGIQCAKVSKENARDCNGLNIDTSLCTSCV
ncbi:hypothetical protein AX15_000122 [Amanita polypyramis BW_CC]|nr:hypothetical protein AX15_000122 [Amanita polypyramis BW_CC]